MSDMQTGDESKVECPFQELRIFENETPVGRGAFGIVYKAACDELFCVAKLFHSENFEHEKNQEDLLATCTRDFQNLCRLNHPNLVQYLAARTDVDTVALFMEELTTSLRGLVHDHYPNALPFHMTVDISYDVSVALSFLHNNGVAHHNLSSSNILLLGKRRAKVSDFGLAKMKINQAKVSSSWPYLPPELLLEPPTPSERADEFSLGVCMIEMLTGHQPDPSPLMQATSKTTEAMTFQLVLELNRRHNHISLIKENHPMRTLVFEALNNKPQSRPSSKAISQQLQQLRMNQRYLCSKNKKMKKNADSEVLLIEIDDPTRQRIQSRVVSQSKELQQMEVRLKEMEKVMALKQMQLQDKEQQLKSKDHIIKLKESEIDKLNTELRKNSSNGKPFRHVSTPTYSSNPFSPTPSPSSMKSFSLSNGSGSPPRNNRLRSRQSSFSWKKGKPAPVSFQPQSSVVTSHNGKVYISHCNIERAAGHVYEYCHSADTWKVLPVIPKSEFTIVVFQDALLAVGGSRNLKKVNTLHAYPLNHTSSPDAWLDDYFPNMPTARAFPSCATQGQYLLVVGGEVHGDAIAEADVFDVTTKQWHMVRRLPQFGRYTRMVATTVGENTLNQYSYFLGGFENHLLTPDAFRCKISDLIKFTHSQEHVLWTKLSPLPVSGATCITLGDQLVALGGYDSKSKKQSNAIYSYRPPPQDKWEKWNAILPTGFSRGLITVTSTDDKDFIIVLGGNSSNGENCFTYVAAF